MSMPTRPTRASIQHVVLVTAVALLAVGASSGLAAKAADAQSKTRRVLMLYPYSNLFRVSVITGEAARRRLIARSRDRLEFYTDFLDLGRFSGEAYEARTARYLADKYRDRKPDVVMTLGPQALRFALTNRVDLGLDVPVVFCCTSRGRLEALNPPANVTGIVSEFDLTKTMALAERLQPDARHLVVVAGATEFDRQWVDIARRQLAPHGVKYATEYLVGLPFDDLIGRLKRLPRDTIIILLTMFSDSAGGFFIPPELVQDITAAAAAPVYGPYETYLGRGIVGGHIDSLEHIGTEIADMTLSVLADARSPTPAPIATSGHLDRVDWRALKRWNLSEGSLRPDTDVRFRELGLWAQYRWEMAAIALALLIQASLITGLLLERSRRRVTETKYDQRVLELAHMNRTAAAGAMSASIAHELNQPLGAILSNAEAAELLLAAKPLDVEQIRDILADIRQADERAGEIIAGLRRLLTRRDVERQDINVGAVIGDVVQLLAPEARERKIAIAVDEVRPDLRVHADSVHLHQVLLNLALNGMDAMPDGVAGPRRITFAAAPSGRSMIEVSVADTGRGVPADKLAGIFEPFFTTKPHGTGLGLSIVRTIVETYGGTIWAENRLVGGAVFRFTLPLAGAQAA
jgi:signal transduction histidine kinase